MICAECQRGFRPTKDPYVTVHEHKGPSVNFCSLSCATLHYIED